MSDSDRLSPLLSLQWMENLGTLCEPLPGHSSLFLPAIQGECWTYRMGSQSQSMATTVKIGEGGVGPLGIFRHSERQGVIDLNFMPPLSPPPTVTAVHLPYGKYCILNCSTFPLKPTMPMVHISLCLWQKFKKGGGEGRFYPENDPEFSLTDLITSHRTTRGYEQRPWRHTNLGSNWGSISCMILSKLRNLRLSFLICKKLWE